MTLLVPEPSVPPALTTTVKSDAKPAEKRPNTTRPTKNHIMAKNLALLDFGVRSPYLQEDRKKLHWSRFSHTAGFQDFA